MGFSYVLFHTVNINGLVFLGKIATGNTIDFPIEHRVFSCKLSCGNLVPGMVSWFLTVKQFLPKKDNLNHSCKYSTMKHVLKTFQLWHQVGFEHHAVRFSSFQWLFTAWCFFRPGGREPLDGVVQREEAPLLRSRGTEAGSRWPSGWSQWDLIGFMGFIWDLLGFVWDLLGFNGIYLRFIGIRLRFIGI